MLTFWGSRISDVAPWNRPIEFFWMIRRDIQVPENAPDAPLNAVSIRSGISNQEQASRCGRPSLTTLPRQADRAALLLGRTRPDQ